MRAMSEPMESLLEALTQAGSGHLVAITGAGISRASGVPTYRGDDPDAVWKNDIMEKGTYAYFRRNPVGSWRWSAGLLASIAGAGPNRGHYALDALGSWHRGRGGRFTLVTQNIDGLHRRAAADEASRRSLIEVHGRVDRVRCALPSGCEKGSPSGSFDRAELDFSRFEQDPTYENLPRCPLCDDLIRHHVLWFDELYSDHADYQWERVQDAAEDADVVLFVGTSFAVGVTELFLHSALLTGTPTFSIDPTGEVPFPGALVAIAARAPVALPALCSSLGVDSSCIHPASFVAPLTPAGRALRVAP